jgi:glutamate synthase domain-containing protein 1
MCGIVGLFAKSADVEERLGEHLAAMLVQMSSRGPDSAGVAVYRNPAPTGSSKLTLYSPDAHERWGAVRDGLCDAFGTCAEPSVRASHAVFVVDADAADAERWVRANRPDLRVMSAGQVIEIYKETGLPEDFVRTFALEDIRGTHALGHTRMATESRVTTEGSHPFSTGYDLCLVHNGSLSNHNRLRENLRREGIEQALEGCLDDLDGFYTFAVGTADGFAVLRDPIACKPAVLAETDDWVAMSSEWRSIAVLPGAADARAWEPEPGVVYAWEKALV